MPRRSKSGHDASNFKINEETGKIVIVDESDDESVSMERATGPSGKAHRESITFADGFIEGSDDNTPKKGTKKRRRASQGINEDIEMADESEPVVKGKKSKLRKEKIGSVFKAKVRANPVRIDENLICFPRTRKPEGTSKKAMSILMHMSRCQKQQRISEVVSIGLPLLSWSYVEWRAIQCRDA
jgi:hypothetical protein